LCLMFFYSRSRGLRDLHSFPTRRSSDLGGELPDDRDRGCVPVTHPSRHFPAQGGAVCQPSVQALPLQHAEFTLGHVQPTAMFGRSEEHTSELQSRGHLVCRLLLEKKNKT